MTKDYSKLEEVVYPVANWYGACPFAVLTKAGRACPSEAQRA